MTPTKYVDNNWLINVWLKLIFDFSWIYKSYINLLPHGGWAFVKINI